MIMPPNVKSSYIDIINIVKDKELLNEINNYRNNTRRTFEKLQITNNIFCQYFVDSYNYSLPINLIGEELYSVDEIEEFYQNEYWINRCELKEKYPKASKRYLQFTSIEGGGSYFYDKETDYVYDVDWGQEEDMIKGELKPWFTSFYDFLEWYYSEDEDTEESTEIELNPKTITLKQLSIIIPWAGLETIEEYISLLKRICENEYKEYFYLFEDLEKSTNDVKLKNIELPNDLVSKILDDLGMILFYEKASNSLSSLTYEDNGTKIIHQKEWTKKVREKGFEEISQYFNEDIKIIKTSQALKIYGYENIEKVYERTTINL